MGLDNSLKKVSAPKEEAPAVQQVASKPVQKAQSSVVPAESPASKSTPVVSEVSKPEETMSEQEAIQAVKACSIDNPDCESCSG